MSQNQQKYDYEFMKPQYYQFIKEEYNKAERVLSDIVSILKSSFDKKYILKNEYIQKVIVMLRDIREIESEIKGIYFAAEHDTLEQPYKGLQEIKENVNALKRYYNGVNLLITRIMDWVFLIDCVNFLEPLNSPIKFDYKMSHSFIPFRDRHGPFFGNIINR